MCAQANESDSSTRKAIWNSTSVHEVERRLRAEGFPLEELAANGHRLVAPGITLKQYIGSLEAFDTVEVVKDVMRYRAAMRQPEPTLGNVDVADYVLADIEARVKVGFERYGTKLQTNNGRDALWDAYQEAIDLVMYLRQEILERNQD